MASMATPTPGSDDIEWIDEGESNGEQASSSQSSGRTRNAARSRNTTRSSGRNRRPKPREPQPQRYRGIIPRDLLDRDALDVVRTLQRNGHEAYLVGGCVRDLLAGLAPKDFDVATDAHPNRIKRLFRRARVIGRRFRLVHVRYGPNHVIETATFRGTPNEQAPQNDSIAPDGRRRDWRDSVENVFGTAFEDAHRRDFTVNALFYDPHDDEVIDWVGGYDDIQSKVIRCIGDPHVRIEEDPVRMLRAVHFSERMKFKVEPALESAIRDMSMCIMDASNARLYVELIKMLSRRAASGTFRGLHTLGVLEPWLPNLDAYLVKMSASEGDEEEDGTPAWVNATRVPWDIMTTADTWDYSEHDAVPDSIRMAALFGPYLLNTWVQGMRGPKSRQAPSRGKYLGRGYASFGHHMTRTFGPVARLMSIPRWATRELTDLLWIAMHLAWEPRSNFDRGLMRRRAFAPALVYSAWCADVTDTSTETLHQWEDEAAEAGAITTMRRYTQTGNARRGGRGPRGGGGGRGRSRRGRGGNARGRTPNNRSSSDRSRKPSRKKPSKKAPRRRSRPAGAEADAHAPPPPRRPASEDVG